MTMTHTTDENLVVGIGSLMSQASLHRTCPSASLGQPVWVSDCLRHAHHPSIRRHEGRGPFGVMGIDRVTGARCNGVLIRVPDSDWPALLEREKGYHFEPVQVADYETDQAVGEALVCVSDKPRMAKLDWEHPQQINYLAICAAGAAAISMTFLNDFAATTEIEGKPMLDHPRWEEIQQRMRQAEY